LQSYCNAAGLGYKNLDAFGRTKEPVDFEGACKKSRELIDTLSKNARTKYLLFNNGCDHLEPQPELPEIIDYLNKNIREAKFIHSNYEQYVKKVSSTNSPLGIVRGEMRSGRFYNITPGTMSTRMYLKQANHRSENALEKYVEPISTFSYLEGKDYPTELINLAWKYLIQCHPHDSICGCSIDQVHKDVLQRLSWAYDISKRLISEGILDISNKIDTTVPVNIQKSEKSLQPLVIYNTVGWARKEVVKVELHFPVAELSRGNKKYHIVSNDGDRFTVEQLSGIEGPFWSPYEGEYYKQELAFEASVPPCGYKLFYLANGEENSISDLKIIGTTCENSFLRVSVNNNGTIKVYDKITGNVYDNLLTYEDGEDAGDEYTYSPCIEPKVIVFDKETPQVEVVDRGPLLATLKVKGKLSLPKALRNDRKARENEMVDCPIETEVSLHSNSPLIRVKTIFENNAKDHRLRVLFPTPIITDSSFAESHFDVVKRAIDLPNGRNWGCKEWGESPTGTYPQDTFVSINDNERGISIVNNGITEYEVSKKCVDGKDGSIIALTLLRCVGWLSRNDLRTRRGHAGPPLETPDAQCLGRQVFRYGILFHKGGWEETKAWKVSHNFNVPLVASFTGIHEGKLPKETSFLTLNNDALIISAIKKSETDDGVIIRLYNIRGRRIEGKLEFSKKVKRAFITDLDEKEKTKIKIDGANCVKVLFKPFQIVTLKLIF